MSESKFSFGPSTGPVPVEGKDNVSVAHTYVPMPFSRRESLKINDKPSYEELEYKLYNIEAQNKYLKEDLKDLLRQSPQRPVNSVASYGPPIGHTIGFQEVKKIINNNYNYQESIESTTLDIIAVYLRGQKILYTEAKVYCEQHLYALMLPAILVTAVCSVISVVLKEYAYGAILVSGLTAANSFILSLVTYLKLDAKAEAHKIAAYSFETLQSVCEFSSGKILLAVRGSGDYGGPGTMELIKTISEKVKEIKEKNQFILPEYIRYNYPMLFGTNVFAEVKRIQNQEVILMNGLKNIINEKMQIEEKLAAAAATSANTSQQERLLEEKRHKEQAALTEIIAYRNQYIEIDKEFRKEIDANIARSKRRWFRCCVWLKT